MKTTLSRISDADRAWLLVDATGKPLGRLATGIANALRGRNKAIFSPQVDNGDFVVVINAEKVKLTGNKEEEKTYKRYSGYRGGLKSIKASTMRERHPERLVLLAVRGMMPRNNLARRTYGRLKVYAGKDHPHAAQNPKLIELV